MLNFRPHNVSMVGLGTFILWFGWLGFNGGSSFGANLRAVTANLRIDAPLWSTTLFAVYFGVVMWAGVVLRRPELLRVLGITGPRR